MTRPLSLLLAASLAAPVLAQYEPKLKDAGSKIKSVTKQDLAKAPDSPAPKPVGPANTPAAPVLASKHAQALLQNGYEVNLDVQNGLNPAIAAKFVVLSIKPEIGGKFFRQRHYMSFPASSILYSLPNTADEYSSDKGMRQPNEVRGIGNYLGITYPDGSVAYYDVTKPGKKDVSLYQPAGAITAGTVSGIFDAALLDDAYAGAGLDAAEIAAAKANFQSVMVTRGQPAKYLVTGSKKNGFSLATLGHNDSFWPTIELK